MANEFPDPEKEGSPNHDSVRVRDWRGEFRPDSTGVHHIRTGGRYTRALHFDEHTCR